MLRSDGGSKEEAAMLRLPVLLPRRATDRPGEININVTMSGLQREVIRRSVSDQQVAFWPQLVGPSPVAQLVNALEDALHAHG